jgi:hypothetical protein
VVAITAPLAFLLLIVYPGFEFVYEETVRPESPMFHHAWAWAA